MEVQKGKEEVYSKRVNAGKRVYFFDIKETKDKEYYLTITESKKRTEEKGISYEKHKIFLYKEDISKFTHALNDVFHYFKDSLMPDYEFDKTE
ncbi:DUF3276 family protein [Cardinium endosymbiont of Culicoides punctatus]|uniref:DUF3276 family protein n=1 Tax=Cardinium endosymbiont of Culicoides punctatus TaxID=2304601 RepID=UPI001058E0A1|nr:DUF3276 family protein [Cardinium endosymbiont of Culicoides punctatus]TDG95359.1 hypothetical protein CCPUN_04530 [Cardinium endosymbiont of Culicoides punctatus]